MTVRLKLVLVGKLLLAFLFLPNVKSQDEGSTEVEYEAYGDDNQHEEAEDTPVDEVHPEQEEEPEAQEEPEPEPPKVETPVAPPSKKGKKKGKVGRGGGKGGRKSKGPIAAHKGQSKSFKNATYSSYSYSSNDKNETKWQNVGHPSHFKHGQRASGQNQAEAQPPPPSDPFYFPGPVQQQAVPPFGMSSAMNSSPIGGIPSMMNFGVGGKRK